MSAILIKTFAGFTEPDPLPWFQNSSTGNSIKVAEILKVHLSIMKVFFLPFYGWSWPCSWIWHLILFFEVIWLNLNLKNPLTVCNKWIILTNLCFAQILFGKQNFLEKYPIVIIYIFYCFVVWKMMLESQLILKLTD